MGFNVKSLYKTDRPLTNSASSQKGLNVRSLRDEEFELKDDDDTTIGKVSYAAKSAIEHNALDSYTPKNEEERKTLHAYREFLNNRTQSQKKTRTQDQTHSNPVAKTYDIDKYAPAKTVLARYQQYTNLPKTTESSGRKPNFWDLTVNSLKRGYVNSLYGQESYKAMTGQKNNKAYYEEKLKSEDYSFIPDAWYENALSGAMELLGQQVKQWTDKRSLVAGTAAAGAAAVAGQIGPQVLAPEEIITVPSAFFAGISAGSAASNFEIEAGLAYNEMIENGVSHETARNIAVGVGAGNAAIEMVQIDDLIKSFKILNTDDATKSVAKKIMSYLKDRGVNIASETAQEVAQETVTTVGANAANKIDKGEWAYDWGEIGQRIGETAASSAMSFGLLGTGGDVINYGVNKTANAITSKRSTPTVSTEVTTAHAETDMDADIDNAAASIQNADVENGDKAVKNESSVSEIPTATSVSVKETTPQSSPNITVPQTVSKVNASGELGELMDSEPVQTFAPDTASHNVKKLENTLIVKGADDVSRQNIVATAIALEPKLNDTGKNISEVFEGATKITEDAVTEIRSKVGATDAYWQLLDSTFKAMQPVQSDAKADVTAAYASAYAETLKQNNPKAYQMALVATDGTDLASALPQSVMRNVMPDNAQNSSAYKQATAQVAEVVGDVEAYITNAKTKIYGAETNTTPADVEITSANNQNMPVHEGAANIGVHTNAELTRNVQNDIMEERNGNTAQRIYEKREGKERQFIVNNGQGLNPVGDANVSSVYDKLETMGLTYDEQHAILEYKSSGSYKINDLLRRNETLSETDIKLKNDINSALDKFPVYPKTVYRDIGFFGADAKADFDSFIAEHKGKDVIEYPYFLSSSKTEDNYTLKSDFNIHYEIESRTASDVEQIGLTEEKEVLFKADTAYAVDEFIVDGNNINIKLREIEKHAANNRTYEVAGDGQNIANRSTNTENQRANAEVYRANDGFRGRNETDVDVYSEQSASNGQGSRDRSFKNSRRNEIENRNASLSEGVVDRINSANDENLKVLVKKTDKNAIGMSESVKNTSDNVLEKKTSAKKTNELFKKLTDSIPLLENDAVVYAATGNEFEAGEKKLSQQVYEYFESLGGIVHRENFGDVAINDKGVDSSIAHGMGRAKAIAFASVPAVIEKGRQIDFAENWKGRNYDSYVFAAPIQIGSQRAYVGVVVTKSDTDNRYYLHEVSDNEGNIIIIKKGDASFKSKSEAADNSSLLGETSPTTIIAQGNDTVNSTDAEKDTSNLTAKPKEALKKETESGIIKENAEKDGVKPRHVGTAELQQRIKEQLADGVHAVDDITQGVGAAVSDVNVALLKMELNGEVKRKAGNRYELTDAAAFEKTAKTGETTDVITDVKDVSDVNDGEQAVGGMESDSGRHDTTRKNTVLSAVNHTLKTEIASDSGLMSMLSNRFGGDGLTALTDELITRYDEHGDIGDFAELFSDNGKALCDALQQEETKQAKYSLSDDADIFRVAAGVSDYLSKQVDSRLNGTIRPNEQFEMGQTPTVLRALGAKDLPIVMSRDVMAKMTGLKHSISTDEIKRLPNAIADPVMVFQSATVPNAFVILAEMTDKHGDSVVAALHLNRTEKHINVNRIASVYGKENIVNFVEKQSEIGNLLYIDKNKSQQWSQSRGLRLPKLADTIADNNSILRKEELVNTYHTKNNEKYTSESEDFSNGTIPQISELNKFRYSISEDNVISVSTTEIPVKYSNINEARKAFVEYAQKNFPRNVININTRAEIGISRTGIDKFLSGNISLQKYATGFELPELLRTAKKVGEAENKKGKTGIIGYEYYDNSVNIDGKPFAVHIRVRNTDMGNKYYGHTISQAVEDIKIEPLARNSDKKTVHSVNAFGSDNDIVSQNGNTVNDKNMQNSKKYSSESEDFSNGQAGNDLLSGNSRRTADARTGKQAEAVSSYQRKLEGKKRAERKSTAKELAVKGYTEEVIDGNHKYTLIKKEGYNDDMRQIVSEAKAYGKEVGFFIGNAVRKFDGQRNFKIDGIKLSDNKILIRYDGVYSPQALLIHELVHTEWDNSEMQKARDVILSDLSESDKKEILQNGRYKDYMELYNGDEDAVWEEFIADIFADMNKFSDSYIDTAVDYWYNDKVIDRYNPSEYSESIDTGGNEAVLDNIGFGNEYSLSGNDFDIPYNEKRQLDDYVLRKNHSSDTLEKVDCKEIGNNFYVWENNSKTDYTVVNMIEIDGNEDLISILRKDAQDGSFRTRESVRKAVAQYNGKFGSGNRSSVDDTRREKTSGNGSVVGGVRADNGRGNIAESSGNKQTKYALNSEGGNAEFWDEWLNLAKKYGVIPQGENSVREVHAPKKISKTQVVSRFARTMMEAGATPEWAVSEFEKSVLDGTMTHEVITDQGAKNAAAEKIQRRGFAKSLDDWDEMILSGRIIGKNEMALGQMLYNQCINAQDATHAMKIAADLANIATQAGQTVQACRLLKTMTPDCQLYSLELSVRSMQKELEQQRSLFSGKKQKNVDLTINEELASRYLKAKTEEKRSEMMDAMLQDIADQIPATIKDKFDAWRYLAMLGNPRTHARNVLGNATFMLPIRIKNNIAWVLERTISKEQRTKALKSTAAGKQFAENDYTVMKEILQNGGRFEGLSRMNEMRTVFRWIKPLESLRKFNSAALEWEDGIFLKHHYINAMAQCITARGYSAEFLGGRSIEANQALADVREYAMLEAQKATYRDAGAVADALSKWQRKMRKSDKLYERAAGVAVEGAIPFKKTPLNIAKRGVEYSPLGLMKGIYDAAFSVKNGKKTAAQAIDAIAAGLTGTAVMLLGLYLRRIGLVRGTGSGDEGEERLDSATGYQDYALMVGDSSYTIDWLAPISMPFFMGVNLWDSYEQADKFTFENVVNAVIKIPDPLLSLSVLSSLNDILKAGDYAKTDAEKYGAYAWQMGVSYLGQAFPTISGQIARTIDGTQRDTYHADKTNGIPDGLERFLMKQMAKIPWLSKNLNPVIDMWGREESYGDTVGDRLIGNMISPGYYKEIDSTFLDNELRRLNQEYEGEESVFPPKIQSSFDYKKKKYIMTPTEYTRYSIVRGRTSYELADELVRSKKYRKMSAEEKQKALKSCYTTAGEKAKFEILKGRGVDVSGTKKTSKTK